MPIRTMDTCYEGTRSVAYFCLGSKIRMIHVSTAEVYGDSDNVPQEEDDPGSVALTGPRTAYAEGKRAAEALVHSFCKANRLDARVARLGNVYGSGVMKEDGRVFHNFIRNAVLNVPLKVFGGYQIRTFVHVDDVCLGLMKLAEAENLPENSFPINLAGLHATTIYDLAETIIRMVGSRSTIEYLEREQDDPDVRRPAIKRALQYLEWTPLIDLEEGLTRTIKDIREQIHGEREYSID